VLFAKGKDRSLLFAEDAGDVTTLDWKTGEVVLPSIPRRQSSIASSSPSGERIAMVDALVTSRIELMDVAGVRVHPALDTGRRDLTPNSPIPIAAGRGDGFALFAANTGGPVQAWSLVLPPASAYAETRTGRLGVRDAANVAATPDGSFVAAAVSDGLALIAANGDISNVAIDRAIDSLVVTSDGRVVVVSTGEELQIWHVGRGELSPLVRDVYPPIALDLHGACIAATSKGGDVEFFDLDGQPVHYTTMSLPEKAYVTSLVFDSGDPGRRRLGPGLFRGLSSGDVHQFDLNGLVRTVHVSPGADVNVMALHPSGETMFVCTGIGLRTFDVDYGSVLNVRLAGAEQATKGVAISADGRLLFGARDDGTIAIWRATWREWAEAARERVIGSRGLFESESAQRALATLGIRIEQTDGAVTGYSVL
jgi:WD40 repeat protein